MRIRKNAKISVLSLSHASTGPCERETLQTRVCELNRSPWDVMAFAPQSDFSYPDEYQVEIHARATGNSVGGESVSAVKSVYSLNEVEEEEEEEEEESERKFSFLVDVDRENKTDGLKRGEGFVCCNKTDGKGWKCKREAKEGHSLCDHHLTQLRSYHYSYSQSSRKSDDTKTVAVSRRRNRDKISKSSSTAPSDFYYYSGFGPLWGKKRAGGREEKVVVASSSSASSGRTTPISSHVDLDIDDDDDDENGGDSNGKKRVRKPIKARSLKSLL